MSDTILYLLERIARARMVLEGMEAGHGSGCPQNDAGTCSGPCVCGADRINATVHRALCELRIEPNKIRMG